MGSILPIRLPDLNGISPFATRVDIVLVDLLQAYDCAQDTSAERWDFAVGLACLKECGIKQIELRWLVKKGFVEHGKEITPIHQNKREFRATGELVFHSRTCFVLTDAGVEFARSSSRQLPVRNRSMSLSYRSNVEAEGCVQSICVPHWDAVTRTLSYGGKIVKRYRWQAVNQELVLKVFQEEKWRTAIDDPLPPKDDQDSKARLQDTIKALNRNHECTAIRFRGDGSASRIIWELSRDEAR